jgi:organic hydroperoxide reductase OsmC/OhrA
MSEHTATVRWQNANPGPDFGKGRYSREHTWSFDGGLTMPASPSPSVVPAPYSNPANVDPEEAFVASVSSCHMLFFLFLAGRRGFQVDSYEDQATGVLAKNTEGRTWMSQVTLRPRIAYGGDKRPTPAELDELHHGAHEQCFIANSVRTEIRVEPREG